MKKMVRWIGAGVLTLTLLLYGCTAGPASATVPTGMSWEDFMAQNGQEISPADPVASVDQGECSDSAASADDPVPASDSPARVSESEEPSLDPVASDSSASLSESPVTVSVEKAQSIILNTSTHVFHTNPSCSAAQRIKEENRVECVATITEVTEKGYHPCGFRNCAAGYQTNTGSTQ